MARKRFRGMFGVFSGPTTGANGGSSPGLTLDGVVALGLTDQPFSGTITLATHFSIPCVSGSVLSQTLYIRETLPNGTISQIPAQFEPAAYWPDGSVKWVHAHCNVQWVSGVAATYHLIWGYGISAPVGSTLTAVNSSSGINVDTGTTTFCILNNTPGIKQGGAAPKVSNSSFVLYNGAIPYSVSGVGCVVESSGTQQIIVKTTGWLSSASNNLAPCKFETRFKARAGSSIVDVDHATVFVDDMRRYPQLNSHGFYLTYNTRPQILTKDFAKKVPFQIEDIDATNVAVAMIPSIATNIAGAPSPLTGYTSADYDFYEAYKLAYLSKGSGQYLNPGLPAEYRVALTSARVSGDTSELTINTIQNADMIGVAMHCKFAINLGTSGSALQNIYELYPVGYVAPTTAAATQVLGKVEPFSSRYTGTDYNFDWLNTVDSGCRNSLMGKYNNHNRYNESGWHIFGNTHEDEYPGSTGTLGNIIARPSYHRVWSNNHNGEAGALWQLYFASAETGILKQARIATDYVASINTCHHTPTGSYQDAGSLRYPGVMYHCKSFSPWGLRRVGDNADDQDMGFVGHFVWPECMLWSWLMDADRWSKATYETWLSGVTYTENSSLHYTWPVTHYARETNTSLNQAMIAYEHYPNTSGLVRDIHRMAHSIVDAAQICSGNGAGNNAFAICGGLPYATGQAGALWPPTFLSRYYDLFPGSGYWTTFMDISAQNMKMQQFTEGVVNAALNATQYLRSKPSANVAGSGAFIEQFEGLMDRWPRRLYNGSSGVFQYYGNTYEPDKDGHFSYQWPRFKYALKQYIKDFMGTPASPAAGPYVWDASTLQLEEVGQYWSASTNGTASDTKTRGIKIYVLGDTSPLHVDVQAIAYNGGNIPGTNFWFQNSVYTGDNTSSNGTLRYVQTAVGGMPLGTGIQGFAGNQYGGWTGPTLPMSLPSVQDYVVGADPNNVSGACCGRTYTSYEYKYNITYTRPTSWLVQREQYIIPSTGLTELLFGSNGIEIFRPLTSFPECQVLQSNWGTESDGYILKNVSGYLWPIMNQPLIMTFRAGILGTENTMKNPIYINVNGSGQWLLTGQTGVFTIPGQRYTPVYVFGDLDAHCKVTFDWQNNAASCYPATVGYRALFGTSGNIAQLWPLISGATF